MEPKLQTPINSARLKFRDGETIFGTGYGAEGIEVAELCFNTSMTGYQEILTDPSYYKQILTFTFPHIGNVGTNLEDYESSKSHVSGIITSSIPTNDSSWRSEGSLINWMTNKKVIGICDVDTRKITKKIRDQGAQDVAIEHRKDGKFIDGELSKKLLNFPGLEGLDLARNVSCRKPYNFTELGFPWIEQKSVTGKKVIAIDYGIKTNILRKLASYGFEITVVPANFPADEILKLNPRAIFLSNGPGDPAATHSYSGPIIKTIISQRNLPVFGICLGHQLLGLALGAQSKKMHHGHHGANHPVKELKSGKVMVTSMNHGFAIDSESLPKGTIETYKSLFDGSNCGIEVNDRPIFSVQFHPEASPGPMDADHLFQKFASFIE